VLPFRLDPETQAASLGRISPGGGRRAEKLAGQTGAKRVRTCIHGDFFIGSFAVVASFDDGKRVEHKVLKGLRNVPALEACLTVDLVVLLVVFGDSS